MREFVFTTAQWLYHRRLFPFRLWSFIYDRYHRAVRDQWKGIKKGG